MSRSDRDFQSRSSHEVRTASDVIMRLLIHASQNARIIVISLKRHYGPHLKVTPPMTVRPWRPSAKTSTSFSGKPSYRRPFCALLYQSHPRQDTTGCGNIVYIVPRRTDCGSILHRPLHWQLDKISFYPAMPCFLRGCKPQLGAIARLGICVGQQSGRSD